MLHLTKTFKESLENGDKDKALDDVMIFVEAIIDIGKEELNTNFVVETCEELAKAYERKGSE